MAQLLFALLQLLEERLGLGFLAVEARPRVLDDGRGQAEPLGHLEREAASRDPEREPVGRLVGLRVVAEGRARHPQRRLRGGLHQPVVRRGHHRRAARAEVVDDRDAERSPLGRVGARSHLVEEHESRTIQLARHLHDGRQVRGEGRQVGRDRLLVADIGVDLPEDREPAPGRGGDVEAALRHEAQETYGLEGHRLPARVGPADHEHTVASPDAQGHRHGVAAGSARDAEALAQSRDEERMASVFEFEQGGAASRPPGPPRARVGSESRRSRSFCL